MYKKVTPEDIEFLRGCVSADRVLTRQELNEDYSHDELAGIKKYPEVLVRVLTTAEISAIMTYAYEQNIPVVVRGAGTGLVGACVAVEGGIMIETIRMNQILELDEDNLTVTVQPGVLLMELAKFAEDHDYLYPPDPGEKSATIGGNISTNAGGMRAVKYGVTRDYVRGLTIVLPDGTVQKLGGKVVKNSTGYSLKDLIVGSEGTLAIVTEAILKLVPLPKKSVSLLVPFSQMEQAIDAVPVIIKSKASLTAIEFMERQTVLYAEEYLGKKFPDNSGEAYLLLTVDGNVAQAVDEELENVAKLCLEQGALDVLIVDTEERKQSVWSARGAFLEAIKASAVEMDECDVVVPRSSVAEFIKYTHSLETELGVRIPSFGHAGDGNLHVYVCRDALSEEEFHLRLEEAFDKMYQYAAQLSGLVSGEHGIGYAKKEYMSRLYGDTPIELMRGIKKVFDPKNILNPHKVI